MESSAYAELNVDLQTVRNPCGLPSVSHAIPLSVGVLAAEASHGEVQPRERAARPRHRGKFASKRLSH